jgi:hypothetical protein
MTKSKAGRPGTIQSEYPLERVSTRISVEAIAILKEQTHIAKFVDEAIKEKANLCDHVWDMKIISDSEMQIKCTKCGETQFSENC